jgi:hypothetical protein
MASDDVDPHAIGAEWTVLLAAGLERSMVARAHVPFDVFDVQFADFIRDEVGMVRRIYERFGLVLSTEAETRMRRFLAENPKDKHGAHRYTLAAAGLDPAVERRRYAAYQERFGVPSEPVS